jgi:hypothetical protein
MLLLQDLSKYLSVTLEEDEEGAMPQTTDTATLVSQPPLKNPRIPGAGSSRESVQQKAKEVVACSCSELAQQRDSGNSAPIAQPPSDDEDTETLSHRKKRKFAEVLACSTVDVGSVHVSPPQAASLPPQSEPCLLRSSPARHASPTTRMLPTLTAPKSIKMTHVPCRPLPHDNLGSSQQSDGFAMDCVEVEGEVHGKKAKEEPGMLYVQMKDAESKLLWEINDEKERTEVEWEKVKEAATSFMTRLPEITLSLKRASEMIVKLKQENKDLEIKLKQENKDLEVKLKQENEELEVKLKQENKELEVKLKQENKDLEVKLKQENKELEVKLKQENKELEVKLKQENKDLEVKLKQENKELEVKLKQENEVARGKFLLTPELFLIWTCYGL